MRVYFDTSCLGRPIDNRAVPRNAVEREAILAMFAMARRDELTLVISEAVMVEIDQTPDMIRRGKLQAIARVFQTVLPLSDETVRRGAELQRQRFKAFDALHIAVAEAAGLDRLCTGDDRLKTRCKSRSDIRVRVVSPIELYQELQA
jgi:predicted nucleic acid-binding protein